MAKKKEEQTLPMNAEMDTEPSSSITYANEVIAIIAGLAASEVEGVAGMVNVNSGIKGKNKNITRGVKVEVGAEEVSVDLYLNVEYGVPIQRVALDAQESVKKSIESMTGLHVVHVDVHVQGVSFEKENNALQAGAGNAVLEAGDAPEAEEEPEETGSAEESAAAETPAEPEAKEPAAEEIPPENAENAEEDAEAAEPEEAVEAAESAE